MPKIPSVIQNSAFYLFPTVQDAEHGSNFEGTGFIIALPSKRHAKYGYGFLYAVTNWHVACRGSPVIRLNTKSGPPDIFAIDVDKWVFDPRFDIAVLSINLTDNHHIAPLHEWMLVTQDFAEEEFGPGDDVFMVGRFMDHAGKDRNHPALRCGNIAMNPTPIIQENGAKADAYCIDLHSRSGYSGSPVFVYRTPGSYLVDDPRPPNAREQVNKHRNFFKLLGIHFAQFPEMWEVTSIGKLRHEVSNEPLLTDGKYIRGLSGMTCVLPAWNIHDVLYMKQLQEDRAEKEEKREAMFQREGYPPLSQDAKWQTAIAGSEDAP